MKYYVYMLKSNDQKSKTYVGWTNNLKKRLSTHNSGMGAKSTRGKIWHMIYCETFNSKKDAMRREYFLKRDKKLRKRLKEEV